MLTRLGRLPVRLWNDCYLVSQLKNWREVLRAEVTSTPLRSLRFRNGVVLFAPPEAHLDFLLAEIWVRQCYTPAGYKIRSGHVVIDIGADIGVFAAFAATRANGVRVLAFEPLAENATLLRENVASSVSRMLRYLKRPLEDRLASSALQLVVTI